MSQAGTRPPLGCRRWAFPNLRVPAPTAVWTAPLTFFYALLYRILATLNPGRRAALDERGREAIVSRVRGGTLVDRLHGRRRWFSVGGLCGRLGSVSNGHLAEDVLHVLVRGRNGYAQLCRDLAIR